VTGSALIGRSRDGVDPPVRGLAHLQGILFLVLMGFRHRCWPGPSSGCILPIGILTIARALVLVALAHRHRRLPPAVLDRLPSVTVIIPAYNEQVGIADAVSSIAGNDYPAFDIVVVDDGSTDRTAEVVGNLGLPNVHMITQPNAGKPTALNTGIAASTGEIVVMVDGDTVFDSDTVRWLVQPFAAEDVGAVSGNTKVGKRRDFWGAGSTSSTCWVSTSTVACTTFCAVCRLSPER